MTKKHELESPLKKRRSLRLKDREAANKALVTSHAASSSASHRKRRIASDGSALIDNDQGYNAGSSFSSGTGEMVAAAASGSDCKRLKRETSSDLDRREKRITIQEQDLKDRFSQLEERILSLEKKEDQTSLMMSQLAEQKSQSILNHLEENFTCALCHEILASPYSLIPPNCGHTFCAICILKWLFSRLHRICGSWHDSVDCPICRSILISPHEDFPRLQTTFPFVPNRVTASVIESLMKQLTNTPLPSQAKVKREESEAPWASQSRKDRGKDCVRKRESSEEKESAEISNASDVTPWREGGHMRAEWLSKDREGREEMTYLLRNWAAMESQDYILMKARLGV